MANITAAREMPLEGMPDAPDEEWLRAFLDQHNALGRQVVSAIQGQLTTEENTTSRTKTIDLVHGQSITVTNPLDVPIQAIYAIGCIGLETGSDGKPNGGIYDLAIPEIVAKPSTKSDGSWIVTAYYPTDGMTSGYIGEKIGPISRLRNNALQLTSNAVANVCTTPSITLTAGSWHISPHVGFDPDNTTSITQLAYAVSAASATLPSSNTIAVPTNGELEHFFGSPAEVPVNDRSFALGSYEVDVSTGSTLNLFLVARGTFSVASLTVYGSLEAVRIKSYMTGTTGRVNLMFFGG